jgi:hypothetical protein
MSRCLGVLCAGVLAVAAAGCTVDSFLMPSLTTFKRHQAITGTVPEVSRRIEDGLSDAGILVITKQLDDGERRLAGQDKQSGRVFCVHLYGKKVGKVDKTMVSIEMDNGANDAFWQMILGFAAGPGGDSESPPDGGAPRLPVRR